MEMKFESHKGIYILTVPVYMLNEDDVNYEAAKAIIKRADEAVATGGVIVIPHVVDESGKPMITFEKI